MDTLSREASTGNAVGAAQVIGEDNAFKFLVLPMGKHGERITVAATTDDITTLRDLTHSTRHSIEIVEVIPAAKIREKIRELYSNPDAKRTFSMGTADLGEVASGLLDQIIETATLAHSSDIHLEPVADSARVRLRIDRTLRLVRSYSLEEHAALTSLIKQKCNLALDKQRHLQDGSFHYKTVNGRDVDVRASVIPLSQDRQEKFILRLLGNAATLRRFADLGMPEWIYDRYRELAENTTNLHLVAGPTGAGKTSTVCSILAEAEETTNIMTIEDPVEIRLPGNAWQVSVDERTGVTFPTAMRAFMRADPDVIMCGEIRDAETAKEACAGGLAGRRVWGTTHAPDAIRALQRLLEFGVHRSTIAQSVKSVLAQRIVRRLCPDCREPEPIPFAIARQYERLIVDNETGKRVVTTFYRQATAEEIKRRGGCKKCSSTGISGQRAVFELLVMTDELEDAIVHEASRAALYQIALSDECGYLPMRYHAVSLLCEGETSVAELRRASLSLTA
jgi:type II secretory ATPase GspE/PulE/Tfp pilus assembly ATPase PilB-like protein